MARKVEKRVQKNTSQSQAPRPSKLPAANTAAGGKKIVPAPAKSKNTNLKGAHPNPNVKGSLFPKRGRGR